MIKICEICSKEFETKYSFQKYCSAECRLRAERKNVKRTVKKIGDSQFKIYKGMIKAPKSCPDQVYCTECSRPKCKHDRARL